MEPTDFNPPRHRIEPYPLEELPTRENFMIALRELARAVDFCPPGGLQRNARTVIDSLAGLYDLIEKRDSQAAAFVFDYAGNHQRQIERLVGLLRRFGINLEVHDRRFWEP